MSCGYEGPHFGGGYNDGRCVDGYLWDLDSCESGEEGEGMFFASGGDIPCPNCNLDEFVDYHAEDVWCGGNAHQRRKYARQYRRELRERIIRTLGLSRGAT